MLEKPKDPVYALGEVTQSQSESKANQTQRWLWNYNFLPDFSVQTCLFWALADFFQLESPPKLNADRISNEISAACFC